MYFLAIFVPPLAILLTGRPFQAILSLFIWPFLLPSILWAILVVGDHKANKRAIQLGVGPGAKMTTNVQVNNIVVVNTSSHSSSLIDEMVADQRRAALQSEQQAKADRNRRMIVVLASIPLALKEIPGAATKAYHELPEWSQPVTWGLAAGTPFSIIAMILFLRSK